MKFISVHVDSKRYCSCIFPQGDQIKNHFLSSSPESYIATAAYQTLLAADYLAEVVIVEGGGGEGRNRECLEMAFLVDKFDLGFLSISLGIQ